MRITVAVNPPGAAGTEASSSGSSKVSVSCAPLTAAAASIGTVVSGVTLTSTVSVPVKPSASLPAASRIFVPEEGGRYSIFASSVPSAIRSAIVSLSFVGSVPSTATRVTAGLLPVPIFTWNPPSPSPPRCRVERLRPGHLDGEPLGCRHRRRREYPVDVTCRVRRDRVMAELHRPVACGRSDRAPAGSRQRVRRDRDAVGVRVALDHGVFEDELRAARAPGVARLGGLRADLDPDLGPDRGRRGYRHRFGERDLHADHVPDRVDLRSAREDGEAHHRRRSVVDGLRIGA